MFEIGRQNSSWTKVVVQIGTPANAAALTALGQRAKFYLLDFIREDGITAAKYSTGAALLGLYHRHKRS